MFPVVVENAGCWGGSVATSEAAAPTCLPGLLPAALPAAKSTFSEHWPKVFVPNKIVFKTEHFMFYDNSPL